MMCLRWNPEKKVPARFHPEKKGVSNEIFEKMGSFSCSSLNYERYDTPLGAVGPLVFARHEKVERG